LGKKDLTNTETLGIGCVVFIVAFVLIATWLEFGIYFFMAIPVFLFAMLPPIMGGLLIGKSLVKTRIGTWLGAVLGAIVGYYLFFFLASRMMFD
jgi:hypothetical protein